MKMPIKLSSIHNFFRQDREDYRARGDRLRDTSYWAEAAEAYAQYLAQHPDDFTIWVQRGNCLKDAGEYSGALMSYSQAIRLDPGNADVYLQMGHLAKLSGAIEDARNYYLHSFSLDPDNTNVKQELERLPPQGAVAQNGLGRVMTDGSDTPTNLRIDSPAFDDSSAVISARLNKFKVAFAKLNV
jgi:tetratricopeptide (TPR) repeat protein